MNKQESILKHLEYLVTRRFEILQRLEKTSDYHYAVGRALKKELKTIEKEAQKITSVALSYYPDHKVRDTVYQVAKTFK